MKNSRGRSVRTFIVQSTVVRGEEFLDKSLSYGNMWKEKVYA